MKTLRWQGALVLAAASLGLFGCQAPPEPEPEPGPLAPPPGLETTTAHYAGSFLTGPTAALPAGASRPAAPAREPDAPDAPGGPIAVRCRMLYLETWAAIDLAPLASETRLVATPRLDQPLASASLLAPGAVRAEGEAARELLGRIEGGAFGRTAALEDFAAELHPLTTVAFEARAIEVFEDKDNYLGEWRSLGPTPRSVGIHVSRGRGDGLELALALEGLAAPPDDDGGSASTGPAGNASGGSGGDTGAASEVVRPRSERLRPGSPVPRFELIVPERAPSAAATPYLLLVPAPFRTGAGAAVAVVVEVDAAPEPRPAGTEGEREPPEPTSAEALRAAAEQAELSSAQLTPGESRRRALGYALEAVAAALTEGGAPDAALRGPLLFLAGRSDAQLSSDLALLAEGPLLTRFATWVVEGPADGTAPDRTGELRPAQLGWRLERSAFQLLAGEQLESGLPPSLVAILLRHGGEAGRYPSLINDLLAAGGDLAGFRELLAAENGFFLEDSNPASRVRAFDWLAARGLAPEGFDPLGDRADRRAALERSREQELQAQSPDEPEVESP